MRDTGKATAESEGTAVTGYQGPAPGIDGAPGAFVRVARTAAAHATSGGFANSGVFIGDFVSGAAPAYRLERFSLAPVVDAGQFPDQPSRLLDARSQIVPFSGREEELAALAGWRDAGTAALSALLLHGPGGEGKTRLAARFAELSAAAGWEVVQARHHATAERPGEEPGRAGAHGLLVIVDYADRWAHPELVELLRDPLLDGPAVRVLLIGRTVQWWAALRGELRSIGAAVTDLPLGRFADSLPDRSRAFATARDRFGAVLGVTGPITETVRGLDGRAYGQVLTLHMAALVAALTARYPGGPMPDSAEGIAAYLLDRERMGWRRLYGSRLQGEEFDTSPTVMARAVFAAVLGGAVSYDGGVARLDRLGLAPVDRVLTDHRFCYPPLNRGQVLEPLCPDRLAEDFVALLMPGHEVSGYDPDPWAGTVPRALLGIDEPDAPVPPSAGRAVVVLASAADRWPHVGAELGALLWERPDIAVQAGSAALVALSEATYVDTDVLLDVEMRLPEGRQVDLDVGAAAVTDRLVRERVDDTSRLQDAASWYSRLGVRLAYSGRKEEAVRANHKALAALHRLKELDPQTYGSEVAVCMMDIGGYLSDLGRHEEAVGFTRRATELLRAAVVDGQQECLPHLALAWANYGNQLQNTGQRAEALEAAREAVEIYRGLAGTDLADPPRLAFALGGLGTRLLAVGQYRAARKNLSESAAMYRELTDAAPQTHLPGLARVLTNLGTAYSRLQHGVEALQFAEQAVRIRRDLFTLNPQAHTADLALSLLNHAGRLSDVGRDEKAVTVAEEAVNLARKLFRADRVAHGGILAHALASHGAVLAQVDRDGAVASLNEAAELYERLVLVDDGYESPLDAVRHNLRALDATDRPPTPAKSDAEVVNAFNKAVRLVKAGRPAEAEEPYRRAAEAGLPEAMYNLGHLYRELGRTADAKSWWTRAVTAGVTAGCHDLGVLHWKLGDRDTARRWFRRGAEAGATNAMVSLGAALWDDGDLMTAEHWFRTAAQAGEPDGDHRLGLLLAEQGRPAEAEISFARAAEAGHAEAMRSLADHRMRHGRVTDAAHWWRISDARGEPGRKPQSPPQPKPDHPLLREARERGIPAMSLLPEQSADLATELLTRRVAALVEADRLEEAVALYQGEVTVQERLLAATQDGSIPPVSPTMLHSMLRRRAVMLADLAPLEQALDRTDDALAHSEEAVTTLGALAARGGDAMPHARAQCLFAAIRAAAGTDLERAATAVDEAITTFTRLASASEEVQDNLRRVAILVKADLLDHAGRHQEAARLRHLLRAEPDGDRRT
ncbi:tetratricopeptide repeat protein [Streptomyces sp. NPDC000987]|uniref:tetratricopeptide repeat protein n=1 Tax=Streptomyces sp. NPDC000987 TaxID=3154374 RepID=UPI00332E6E1B